MIDILIFKLVDFPLLTSTYVYYWVGARKIDLMLKKLTLDTKVSIDKKRPISIETKLSDGYAVDRYT